MSGLSERQASLAARLVPSSAGGRASQEAGERVGAAAAAAVSSGDEAGADAGSAHGDVTLQASGCSASWPVPGPA